MKNWVFLASVMTAAGVSVPVSAQELPSWDPAAICAQDSASDYCRFLETQARGDIAEQWNFIPVNIRAACLTQSKVEGEETWRILGDCLARAARGGVTAVKDIRSLKLVLENDSSGGAGNTVNQLEIDGLRAELQSLQDRMDSRESAVSARIAALQGELDSANTELLRLRGSASGASDAAARVAELETQIGKRDAAITGLNALITTLRRDNGDAARIAELEEQMSQRNAAVSARIAGLQGELDSANGALFRMRNAAEGDDSADGRIAELETEILGLNALITALRKNANEKDGMIASVKSESGASVSRLERLLENTRGRTARISDTVVRQRGRIRDLEGRLSAAEKRAKKSAKEARLARASAPAPAIPAAPANTSASCAAEIRSVIADGGISFQINSADLSESALPVLNRVADTALSCPAAQFRVEGHTDSIGDPAYNLDLSRRRAESVVSYLNSRGVPTRRLEAAGFGPDRPVASNASRQGRALNRRIEFVLK